jgi:hypothetical protein
MIESVFLTVLILLRTVQPKLPENKIQNEKENEKFPITDEMKKGVV